MYLILYKKNQGLFRLCQKKSTFHVTEEFLSINTSYNTLAKG